MVPAVPVQVGVMARPTLAPLKWSPSSAEKRNVVLEGLIPSDDRRLKNGVKAALYWLAL